MGHHLHMQLHTPFLFTLYVHQPILHTYTIGWGVPHHIPMQLHTPFSYTLYVHHAPVQLHTLINDPSHRIKRILIFAQSILYKYDYQHTYRMESSHHTPVQLHTLINDLSHRMERILNPSCTNTTIDIDIRWRAPTPHPCNCTHFVFIL